MKWDPRVQECIPALTTGPDLRRTKLNLADTFRQADQIAAVHGDTPGETLALLEWLLGLIYASEQFPETTDEWQEWVQEREPLDAVAAWIENHTGCWDLFDSEQPLGQNPVLLPHLDTHGVGPAQLFMERVGDYNQFFDHHHLHHPQPVPADSAWRAMLVQHAFAIGMRGKLKATAMNLPGTFTNLGTNRLAPRLRIIARPAWDGATLGDLLRVNTAPWPQAPGPLNLTWDQDSPGRRDFSRPGPRQTRTPQGPADLHTVLGRSIALRPARLEDGSPGVDRVLVGAGETLDPLPGAYVDDAVTYTGPGGVKRLLGPSATRDLWRESEALYAAVAERDKGTDLYGRIALLSGRRIHLWAVGLLSTQGKPITWVCDEFPYVPGRETSLRRAAEQGSAICEYAGRALYIAADTAREIAYANARPDDKKKQVARFNGEPEMWAGAADLFHVLLDQVVDGENVVDAVAEFGHAVRALTIDCLNGRLTSLAGGGTGLHARVTAQSRLQRLLDHTTAPTQLKESAA
ncbi:type I-E CRISPR-associated protein Cse1/CasA [Streptomyces californicus]|uniref:type I-E CRISPR-associated protein Cse1/CasA n=1 Tax=Streptomyces californicus TaxID=67351 RepID=UPI00296F6752|nr:type I-E CRISPR-associated protein Cse1/CasA [Streptomyces californicus]MDW4917362.1 type I-E CRISPR-associated protein Cse1/CasA [Streptomyces californicus]